MFKEENDIIVNSMKKQLDEINKYYDKFYKMKFN